MSLRECKWPRFDPRLSNVAKYIQEEGSACYARVAVLFIWSVSYVLRRFDVPPVWLLGFLALAWGQSQLWPMYVQWAPVGGALVVLGGIMMVVAVFQMLWQRTTVIPRRDASALMTGGIFALSRNPIYLGDTFILAGAVVWLGAWPSFWLVPVFMWLVSLRFIKGEEKMLAAKFGCDFAAYRARTRRWL